MAVLSRFPVGSSASTTSGSLASARAIATRWHWPPDRARRKVLGPVLEADLLQQLGRPCSRARGERRPRAAPEARCSRARSARRPGDRTGKRTRARGGAGARGLPRASARAARRPAVGCRRSAVLGRREGTGALTCRSRSDRRSPPTRRGRRRGLPRRTARTNAAPLPYSLRSPRADRTGRAGSIIAPSPSSSSARRPRASADPPAAGARRPRAGAPRPTRPARPGGTLSLAQPDEQLAPLPVDDPNRVGQPRGGRGDKLQMKFRRRRLGPARVIQPLRHPLASRRRQLVDLAIGAVGLPDSTRAQQAGLLEPAQRDVHLPVVQRLGQRPEREREASPQLVAVRGLAREQRQQHLADDAQLVAVERLSVWKLSGRRHRRVANG